MRKTKTRTLTGNDAMLALIKAKQKGGQPSDFEWWKDADAWIPGQSWDQLKFYAQGGGIRRTRRGWGER